jgi:hypothetical protein
VKRFVGALLQRYLLIVSYYRLEKRLRLLQRRLQVLRVLAALAKRLPRPQSSNQLLCLYRRQLQRRMKKTEMKLQEVKQIRRRRKRKRRALRKTTKLHLPLQWLLQKRKGELALSRHSWRRRSDWRRKPDGRRRRKDRGLKRRNVVLRKRLSRKRKKNNGGRKKKKFVIVPFWGS